MAAISATPSLYIRKNEPENISPTRTIHQSPPTASVMGQRHQVFLIARVKSKAHGETLAETRYRCIAALHHQWCYGRLPLRAARRFLTLAKQVDNAQIIREELRNFDNATSSKIPCPYSLFLLASAWTVDLTPGEEYNSRGHILSAEMGSSDGGSSFLSLTFCFWLKPDLFKTTTMVSLLST